MYLLIYLVTGGIKKIETWQYNRLYGIPQERKPSLVMSFLKAKKEKICPAIVWEEKETVH